MTRDLPPASLLNRRLYRLSLSLDLAHGFATLGSFAGGLAASVVVVACVDRWLVTIPAAWGRHRRAAHRCLQQRAHRPPAPQPPGRSDATGHLPAA